MSTDLERPAVAVRSNQSESLAGPNQCRLFSEKALAAIIFVILRPDGRVSDRSGFTVLARIAICVDMIRLGATSAGDSTASNASGLVGDRRRRAIAARTMEVDHPA